MKFISTRKSRKKINFKEVTLKGLAEDGGLFVPNDWENIKKIKFSNTNTFQEVAFFVIKNFVGKTISNDRLKLLIKKSYNNFLHNEITPLKKLDNKNYLLELFHGPTLAFKDIALQFLGNLFEYFLERKGEKLTIIGATSGDTGSAAIEAVKNNKHSAIFILHPYHRVSDFQRRQMTTVISDNVYNIAIKGNFDDCQNIIKILFRDKQLNKKLKLGSINSINWSRIMAQITYYIYAYHQINKINYQDSVNFSIPTGNFGDAYAGYIAKKKFNIPIKKLIVATNKNNILDKFFRTGIYKKKKVFKTLSPSMDIQVASNFERLLFDINLTDGDRVDELMQLFKKNQTITQDSALLKSTNNDFFSYSVSDNETFARIKNTYKRHNIIIDPHTAVGLEAACSYLKKNQNDVVVTLATAHPLKFGEAVKSALGFEPELTSSFKDIYDLKEKFKILDNSVEDVRSFILENS